MTLQPIVPARPRPRPARCAELTDAHRPTRPVAARRGRLRAQPRRDHSRTLDLTCQFLTHASPTVRAELGQFLADHGQHPVTGLGTFLDCLQLSAARHHRRDHTATEHHQDQQVGPKLLSTWGQKSFSITQPPMDAARRQTSKACEVRALGL